MLLCPKLEFFNLKIYVIGNIGNSRKPLIACKHFVFENKINYVNICSLYRESCILRDILKPAVTTFVMTLWVKKIEHIETNGKLLCTIRATSISYWIF